MDSGSKGIGVLSGDAESIVGDIPGRDFGLGYLEGEGNSDAATACADVEDIPSCWVAGEYIFTEFCRLWAWDKDARGYLKLSSAEFSCAQNILHRFGFLESDDDFFKFHLVV